VRPYWLDGDSRALGDWNILQLMVLQGDPDELAVGWSIMPGVFMLGPVNVGDFVQVFKGNLFIPLDELGSLRANPFLDIWMFGQVVDHHRE
jgi:hypothetical protein